MFYSVEKTTSKSSSSILFSHLHDQELPSTIHLFINNIGKVIFGIIDSQHVLRKTMAALIMRILPEVMDID